MSIQFFRCYNWWWKGTSAKTCKMSRLDVTNFIRNLIHESKAKKLNCKTVLTILCWANSECPCVCVNTKWTQSCDLAILMCLTVHVHVALYQNQKLVWNMWTWSAHFGQCIHFILVVILRFFTWLDHLISLLLYKSGGEMKYSALNTTTVCPKL